jgi:hypothetical protein
MPPLIEKSPLLLAHYKIDRSNYASVSWNDVPPILRGLPTNQASLGDIWTALEIILGRFNELESKLLEEVKVGGKKATIPRTKKPLVKK